MEREGCGENGRKWSDVEEMGVKWRVRERDRD